MRTTPVEELYGHAFASIEDGDTRIGANVYRQFGIGSDAVRRRVFLILEPPEYDEATGRAGVAPPTGRADLYWMGGGSGARSVKPADWSEEFAERAMPKEIEDAINAAHESSRGSYEERMQRMKRVMDRFEKRWKAARARVADTDADETTRPTMPGAPAREPIDSPTPTRRPRPQDQTSRGRSEEGRQHHRAARRRGCARQASKRVARIPGCPVGHCRGHQ